MFDKYLNSKIFRDKEALTTTFIPSKILLREKQIDDLMYYCFAPLLKGDVPNNVFVYGLSGTGKTASALYCTVKTLEQASLSSVKHLIVPIDCTAHPSEYLCAQAIAQKINPERQIAEKGLRVQDFYKIIAEELTSRSLNCMIILDEVDRIVKNEKSDALLLNLIKLNETHFMRMQGQPFKGHLSLLAVTNDVKIDEYLENKTKSRLGARRVVFPIYDADQLAQILQARAQIAFNDFTVDAAAINLGAAIAASHNGDARYALGLLRYAGEIAERENKNKVTDIEIAKARGVVDADVIFEALLSVSAQQRYLFYALYSMEKERRKKNRKETADNGWFSSMELYNYYGEVCVKLNKPTVSARWHRDFLQNLELLGLVTSDIKAGRGMGKKKIVSMACDFEHADKAINKLFNEELF